MAMALTFEVLKANDDKTSEAVIGLLKDDPTFKALGEKELKQLVDRDQEDADKLALGVQQAIEKGVLPGGLAPPEYTKIDVLGKTADAVASEISGKLECKGCVMILVGASGTGKGTTVAKLKSSFPNGSTWSNGNCFRALTLLAATHCEQAGKEAFDPSCLTAENLKTWMGMLEFGKFDGKFDIKIKGLGLDTTVSAVAQTLLQEPKVAKNIPTVAKETQGEVVKFAGEACKLMAEGGTVVLVEGREQTLNFMPSPYRFELVMSDTSVLGNRRAAQRIAGEALKTVQEGDDIEAKIKAALASVAAA